MSILFIAYLTVDLFPFMTNALLLADRIKKFEPMSEMFDIRCSLILLFFNFLMASKLWFETSSKDYWKQKCLLVIPVIRLYSQFTVLSINDVNFTSWATGKFFIKMVRQNLVTLEFLLGCLGFDLDFAQFEIPHVFFICYSLIAVNILCKFIGVIILTYVIFKILPQEIKLKILELLPNNARLPLTSKNSTKNRNMNFIQSWCHFVSRCDVIALIASVIDCFFGTGVFNFAYLLSCLLSQLCPILLLVPGLVIGIHFTIHGLQFWSKRVLGNLIMTLLFLEDPLEALFGFKVNLINVRAEFSPLAEMYDMQWGFTTTSFETPAHGIRNP